MVVCELCKKNESNPILTVEFDSGLLPTGRVNICDDCIKINNKKVRTVYQKEEVKKV